MSRAGVEDYDADPITALGTLIIYSGPKRPKARPPAFGYKFVTTDNKKPAQRRGRRKACKK